MAIEESEQAVKPQPTCPSDFLPEVPPSGTEPKVSRIDFEASGIPQYKKAIAVIIDDLFTPEECAELVSLASQANNNVWDRAMVNIGGGKQALYPDIRNCGRIIFDSEDITARIWARVKPHITPILRLQGQDLKLLNGGVKKGTTKVAVGLNERLRFLRYVPGEFFEKHCDGRFNRTALDGSGIEEFSMYTLHLYLNDGEGDGSEAGVPQGEKLVGGSTSFFTPWGASSVEKELQVKPKIGRVLVFQQANLLHSGEEVLRGMKLTMRTDIMYRVLPAETVT